MKRIHPIISLFKQTAFFLIAIYIITASIVRPFVVVGSSMMPTLHEDDGGIADVISLKFSEPERFDIVIINSPTHGIIVKRIIGLPNEIVAVKEDQLYIDGKLVAQDFLNEQYVNSIKAAHGYFTQDFQSVKIKEGHYFVMGDNRINSLDSRSNAIGLIQRKQIIAKPLLRLWPLSKLSLIGK